jgi:hypothetical protein
MRFVAAVLMPNGSALFFGSGEGGIRTRGKVLRPSTGLANRRYRPLSHLSGVAVHVSSL